MTVSVVRRREERVDPRCECHNNDLAKENQHSCIDSLTIFSSFRSFKSISYNIQILLAVLI